MMYVYMYMHVYIHIHMYILYTYTECTHAERRCLSVRVKWGAESPPPQMALTREQQHLLLQSKTVAES